MNDNSAQNIGTLRHHNIFTSVAVTEVVEEKMTMIITFSTDITNEHVFFNYQIVMNTLLNIICCEITFLF